MYNVFGSGARHRIYAQFAEQAKLCNNGRPIHLLRPAGSRMASFFCGLLVLLRLCTVLLATIYQANFSTIPLVKTNDRVCEAIQDINDQLC